MKKILYIIVAFCGLFILGGCENKNSLNSRDKGITEDETILFIDKYTNEEYKGIEVLKSYSFVNSNGRTERCIFIKNNTRSNLYMYSTSKMLDENGTSTGEANERIDALAPNETYVITEDYYNNYKKFTTTIEVSETSDEPCSNCISVKETKEDDGDMSLTYKNLETSETIGGVIKVIAYKNGKIVSWGVSSIGNLEAGASETEDLYLGDYDKYEVYVNAFK